MSKTGRKHIVGLDWRTPFFRVIQRSCDHFENVFLKILEHKKGNTVFTDAHGVAAANDLSLFVLDFDEA